MPRSVNGIAWIENLLNNSEGISDFRKQTIDLRTAHYLVNIKQLDYEIAYSKIAEWLDKCGRKGRLDFSPRDKISYALKRSLKTGMKPKKIQSIVHFSNPLPCRTCMQDDQVDHRPLFHQFSLHHYKKDDLHLDYSLSCILNNHDHQ